MMSNEPRRHPARRDRARPSTRRLFAPRGLKVHRHCIDTECLRRLLAQELNKADVETNRLHDDRSLPDLITSEAQMAFDNLKSHQMRKVRFGLCRLMRLWRSIHH